MFDQMISGFAGTLRKPLAIGDFDLEADFVSSGVVEGNEKTADVENAAHLRINAPKQRIEIKSRAEGAANIVEDVQLFAAARRLLNQVAIFDRHADLLAEREKQTPLRQA